MKSNPFKLFSSRKPATASLPSVPVPATMQTSEPSVLTFPEPPSAEMRIRLADVGSAGGLQAKWRPHVAWLEPVLFEPSPQSAQNLRAKFPEAHVVQAGLSNAVESRKLYITKNPFCISVLEPNEVLLAEYPNMQAHFEVQRSIDIACTRYDVLHREGKTPQPDLVKIDVQGFEYEVLQGFGDLLHGCLGIELEAHFYPLYNQQKLLPDLISLLEPFGLVLRKIEYVPHFLGEVVEVNAFFTKRRSQSKFFDGRQRWIHRVAEQVWQLPSR
ncbi:FkbM family methyltransferase [Ideonella azotifigens]|uniref:FkbM family methyltransferase n=1 Tax=Ideonella azotifigens TaxID=513160 RepID=UPI001144B682|nr:FkbM family methyltransferase [Ideonella azotifigens]MCD2341050.1 FkbM family methyltransferase [Ideonella azotifigens]